MSAVLQPASVEELAAAVRSAPRVIATGAGTKPRLSAVSLEMFWSTKSREHSTITSPTQL